MDVLWIIHSNLPPYDDDLAGVDSVFFEEISLPVNANQAAIKNACEKWWGGAWPNPPRNDDTGRNKRLEMQALRFHNFEETPRSIEDRLNGRKDIEFIMYPRDMTLADALLLIFKRVRSDVVARN